jgi:hypothetical protein
VIAALLADGTSDKALLPILRWVLACASPVESRVEWIDTASFDRPTNSLRDKVALGQIVCPCDLLFVHRDAEKQPPLRRYEEIRQAVGDRVYVAVVPIRMTEAWLLIDAGSIRAAAGRVSGVEDLELPPLSRLETEADPKDTLYRALRRAHNAHGRRAERFHPPAAVHRLANLVEDWSPLRRLTAFRRLEEDTRIAIGHLGLKLHPAK